jgi:hypothetical protein
MTYEFIVDSAAAALGLGNACCWLLTDERPFSAEPVPREEVDAFLAEASALPAGRGAGYASVLGELGYPSVEPAGQRLVRVVNERGWREYGLLVDACNLVAFRHAAGIGLHDIGGADPTAQRIVVWRAAEDETIVPAFRDSVKRIPAGELVYGVCGASEPYLLAWLGKRDTDAAQGQVNDKTKAALVVVLGYPGLTKDDTHAIGQSIVDLVLRHQPTARANYLPNLGSPWDGAPRAPGSRSMPTRDTTR